MTLGAGLVLMGCGDDDTATTPAPAPPPPPPAPEPEPEPMAPATPTGLHVDETTESSITWHWTASEGAVGYVVQASMDEEFDETDTVTFDGVPFTTATEYTAMDLEPETTVHVRVAAAAGTPDAPLVSEFSEAVAGMSAMPPPPPPEPTPFMVEFSLPEDAKSMYPMIPDDMTDKEKAMAKVNTQMTVTVNMNAIVQPLFVEDASPVGLVEGEQWPFAYVSWNAPQSMVVDTGAQFAVTPVMIGANQMPMPIGNATIVTCGPFACATGEMAPEIGIADSATCEGWTTTLEIDVGLIDNDKLSHTGTAFVADNPDTAEPTDDEVVAVRVFDGLDLGWVYTSNEKFKAEHDLSVVSGESGTIEDESSTELPRMSVGKISLGTGAGTVAEQIYYAMSAEPDETGRFIDNTRNTAIEVGSCQPVGAAATAVTFKQDGTHASVLGSANAATPDGVDPIWAYNDNVSSRVSQPEECFRLTVDAGLKRDYLEPYEVTLTLASADLSWGKIKWDAFEDITCEGRTFTPDVDVCQLLADEVDMLPDPTPVPVVQLETGGTSSGATANLIAPTLAGFNLLYEDAADKRHRFTAMWYLEDTTTPDKSDDRNLYAPVDLSAASSSTATPAGTDRTGRPFGTATQQNLVFGADGKVWVPTIDDDYDPMYGDLGKVSTDGNDEADNYADFDDSRECSASDGGTAASGRNGADTNSTLCHAEDVEIMTSVSFVDGMGLGCDPVKVEYTLTCQWNSRGNRTANVSVTEGPIAVDTTDATMTNIDDFVKCEIE